MVMQRPLLSTATRVTAASRSVMRAQTTTPPPSHTLLRSSSSVSSSSSSLPSTSSSSCRTSYQGFHSSTPTCAVEQDNKNNASRDTRLAGRRRFYKSVGTSSVSAPWKSSSSSSSSSSSTEDQVESPISAGVDGTQSASGVTGNLESTTTSDLDTWQSLLTPRPPGKAASLLSNGDDTTTTTTTTPQWYGVTLDGRTIRTPLGQPLAVPSQSLAWAIAAEWDSQTSELKPAQMPLMTLACTTLDQTVTDPDTCKSHILRYLGTDTTCYWADPSEDRVLHRQQQQSWNELHDFCATVPFEGVTPAKAIGAQEGLLMSRARSGASKSSGLPHPPQVYEKAEEFVNTLDAWHLTALHSVTAEAKSFLVGMTVVLSSSSSPHYQQPPPLQNPFAHDLRKAVTAGRVEEEFQIDNWGLVEGQHDYDRLNASIQFHSAHLLLSSIASENF